MSLFDNQELNQYANLVVNPHDMFSKYKPEDDRYGEINSGTWYNKAYKVVLKNLKRLFCVQIVQLF